MNNQIILHGLEIQSGDLSIKVEEFQVSVDMKDDIASTYVGVLKDLMELLRGEINRDDKQRLETVQEILSGITN